MTDGMILDPEWRARVHAIGKRAFENEEMLRLGFITTEDLARLEASGVSKQQYDAAITELEALRVEVAGIDAKVAELQDVERAIAEIRARRIERVKAVREARRVERAEQRAQRAVEVARRRRDEPTFLGRGVSDRLTFTGGDPTMLVAKGLPPLASFLDIAAAVGLDPTQLQWLTYERGAGRVDHYTRFEIPKRTGGTRLISSPKPALRQAQAWIREHLLTPLAPHPAAMAFRPGVSIVDNATRHCGAGIVVRIDLKDFFPTITFPRVRGFFESLGYNPGVASVLALLCTDAPRVQLATGGASHIVAVGERGLPQGACTSPDLANLIAHRLDRRLTGLATATGWVYTRYADDLVFSASHPDAAPHRLTRSVAAILKEEGFTVNSEKTRVMRAPNRQAVTGLIVNNGVRVSRRDLRRIRAFLHHCTTRGVDTVSQEIGKDARAVARGYLAYVHMVSPATAARLRAGHTWV